MSHPEFLRMLFVLFFDLILENIILQSAKKCAILVKWKRDCCLGRQFNGVSYLFPLLDQILSKVNYQI